MTSTITATNVRPCTCGCGGETKAKFAPGHDARLVSLALTQAFDGTRQFPVGHPLADLNRSQLGAGIARISQALAAKFERGLINGPLYTRRSRKAAVVVVEPTCPACGAKGAEPCRAKDGRRMARPHKVRPALAAA